MATAIIHGLKTTPHDIIISNRLPEQTKQIAKQLAVTPALSHQELIEQADLIILGIKPQLFDSVLTQLTFHQPIISMAAGITLTKLSELTHSDLPLIRIMPNLNAQILKSTTAICANDNVSEELLTTARQLTDSFGSTFDIEEKDFDTFTALAGSSPAYILHFVEALAKSGVKYGIPKEKSLAIVTQTVLASAELLSQSDESPQTLIDKVTSPGGTTIAGLLDLEKTGFTASLISCIDTTIETAKKL